jgi:bacteriophage HK97-gp10 putative tail-component
MFKVSLTGLNQVKAQFESEMGNITKIVSDEVNAMAQDWVAGAVRDAPVDQGALKQAISFKPVSGADIAVEIVAQKFYAPFLEFGTKGKYRPIPGTEAIAAQFKGYKGGDIQEMITMIARWIRKKGTSHAKRPRFGRQGKYDQKSQEDQFKADFNLAWPLVLYILKNGINPHPYFFKQQEIVWPAMIKRITSRIETKSRITVIAPGDINKPRIIKI